MASGALLLVLLALTPCRLIAWTTNKAPTTRLKSQSLGLRRWIYRDRPSSRHFLSSASSVGSSTASSSGNRRPKDKVIFQKVVKALDDDFITSLVDHIEGFELPSDMPMIYEVMPKPASQEEGEESASRDPIIVRWDSPLSPSSDVTRMKVQLVAIAASKDEQQQSASGIAFPLVMVVVQKTVSSATAMPAMMKNLFEDCEKRILKGLDRSLHDFEQGYATRASMTASKQRQTQQSALAELLNDMKDDEQEADTSACTPNIKNAINVDILDEDPPTVAPSDSVRRAVLETMQRPAVVGDSPSLSTGGEPETDDFAIRAAKKAALKQQTANQSEFAVAAAQRVVSQGPKGTNPGKQVTTSREDASIEEDQDDLHSASDVTSALDEQEIASWSYGRPPLLNDKRFISISKPGEFSARRKRLTPPPESRQSPVLETAPSVSGSLYEPIQEVQAAVDNFVPSSSDAALVAPTGIVPQEETFNAEIQRSTEEAIAEMSGQAISPEELLQNVMQFGDKQEQVFAAGAFEKAKELLRDQRRQLDEQMHVKVKDRVSEQLGSVLSEPVELSTEDELRRMFEAGERLADNMIATVTKEKKLSEADERRVDEIITGDKSGVSDYARSLDEDLVELSMRLNKSPGEAMDGPRKNPVFDVFSGPEVYNRNVDPETAVNWPGALPGSTDIRLPKDLEAAVTNARFAADVLSKLRQTDSKYFIGKRELSTEQIRNLQIVVEEAVEIGLIPDPLITEAERSRLKVVIDELWEQPDERVQAIASSYKELLLSDNFPMLIRERLNDMADRDLDAFRRDDTSLTHTHEREREILSRLIGYTQLLLKEARALGAQLEASHLEVIRSICKVAMDPSLATEEDTSVALTEAVKEMRPLFDDSFVAYLKFAVAEEEGRLARAGQLDDPDHNQWLFVLKIVQQGVYAELGKGLSRYVDHIMYVLRMETAQERTSLLRKLIDAMPTLDVRPFVQVVDNIVGSLGDSATGSFSDAMGLGEMTNRLLQLHQDVKRMLPPERIALMSRDADEWAAKQKERLLKNRDRTNQRLRAAEETEYLDDEVESFGSRGEIERIE